MDARKFSFDSALNVIVSAAALSLLAAASAGCSSAPASTPVQPVPKVTTVEVVSKETIDSDEYTGKTEASETVEIRSRVFGFLKSIDFIDGQQVKAGKKLFTIEPEEYEAIHKQSQSRVDLARATLALAKSKLARRENLVQSGAVTKEEYEEYSSAVKEEQAKVAAAMADANKTSIDLKYTVIRAPLSGKIDRAYIAQDNLVIGGMTNGTLLTKIVSEQPMYVYFDVDEHSLLRYLKMRKENPAPEPEPEEPEKPESPAAPARETPAPVTPATPGPATPVPTTPAPVRPAPVTPTPVTPVPVNPVPVRPTPVTPVPVSPVPVSPAPVTPVPVAPTTAPPTTAVLAHTQPAEAPPAGPKPPRVKDGALRKSNIPCMVQLADEKEFKHAGFLDFVSSEVDPQTGTARLRGIFLNEDRKLASGLFVRVSIPVSKPYQALMIPESALATDQSVKFVYVVTSEGTAERRPVVLGGQRGDQRIITSGLKEGEKVIVKGLQRVRPNQKVEAESLKPAAESSPKVHADDPAKKEATSK